MGFPNIKYLVFGVFLVGFILFAARGFFVTPQALTAQASQPAFGFHIVVEPTSLDPTTLMSSAGGYLFTNLYRGLYRYHHARGLIEEGAEKCTWKQLILRCKLKAQFRWSNGDPVTAEQYVRAFQRIIDPNSKSLHAEALLNLLNARQILAGEKSPSQLGVRALHADILEFEFSAPDPEFTYKLVSPAFAPQISSRFPSRENASQLLTTGPYKIVKWTVGKKIQLATNLHYLTLGNRPPVEVYFIENDTTALSLYESGRMAFLRRLVTEKVPAYKNRPDYQQVPVARFDYIGFGPRFKNLPELRKAFATSLDYEAFQAVFHSAGRPGCPALSSNLQDKVHCLNYNPSKAFKLFEENRFKLKSSPLRLTFSRMGGEDILRSMEWLQFQWKTNLKVHLELDPQEQRLYLQKLRANPYDIFRKGVGLDRPTCLAALEIFLPGHPENYIEYDNKNFNKLVAQLLRSTSDTDKKQLCSKAIKVLVDDVAIIPMGEWEFNILAKPSFSGWSLNILNQLDLTDLKANHAKNTFIDSI